MSGTLKELRYCDKCRLPYLPSSPTQKYCATHLSAYREYKRLWQYNKRNGLPQLRRRPIKSVPEPVAERPALPAGVRACRFCEQQPAIRTSPYCGGCRVILGLHKMLTPERSQAGVETDPNKMSYQDHLAKKMGIGAARKLVRRLQWRNGDIPKFTKEETKKIRKYRPRTPQGKAYNSSLNPEEYALRKFGY